jgi:hypothetical protein
MCPGLDSRGALIDLALSFNVGTLERWDVGTLRVITMCEYTTHYSEEQKYWASIQGALPHSDAPEWAAYRLLPTAHCCRGA